MQPQRPLQIRSTRPIEQEEQTTSWIRLRLTDEKGESLLSEALRVPLEALRRASPFFSSKLSRRWIDYHHVIHDQELSSICVSTPWAQTPEAGRLYARCVRLMASSFAARFHLQRRLQTQRHSGGDAEESIGRDEEGMAQYSFSDVLRELDVQSVEDAIRLMEAASSILHEECIDACLFYLSCVPWNEAQTAAIRALEFPHPPRSLHVDRMSGAPLLHNLVNHPHDLIAARLHCYKEDIKASDRPIFNVNQPLFDDLILFCAAGSAIPNTTRAHARAKHNLAIAACCGAASVADRDNIVRVCVRRFHSIAQARRYRKSPSSTDSPSRLRAGVCPARRRPFELLLLQTMVLKILGAVRTDQDYYHPAMATGHPGQTHDYAADIRAFTSSQRIIELAKVCGAQDQRYGGAIATLRAGMGLLRGFIRGEALLCRQDRLLLSLLWLVVATQVLKPMRGMWSGFLRRNKTTIEEGVCAMVGTLPPKDQENVFRLWEALCPLIRPTTTRDLSLFSRASSCTQQSSVFLWPDLSSAFVSWCCKQSIN